MESEGSETEVLEVKTAPTYREVGKDGVNVRERLHRTVEICKRARETGERCAKCHDKLAAVLRHDHVSDTVEFLCEGCSRSAVAARSVVRPATTDPDTLQRYLNSKGL
jgi:hypothetical protein